MYRLNRADNLRAVAHFHAALKLEPEFARAWAGLATSRPASRATATDPTTCAASPSTCAPPRESC